MSVPTENQSLDDAMQRFLHKYIHLNAPVSKLQLEQDESDIDIDDPPLCQMLCCCRTRSAATHGKQALATKSLRRPLI